MAKELVDDKTETGERRRDTGPTKCHGRLSNVDGRLWCPPRG